MARSPRLAPLPRRKRRSREVRLTGDRIVVAIPDNGERQSRGGLLIPATAAPAPKRCIWADVVFVGPDVRTAQPGDQVLFLPQAALEVEIKEEEYLLLRERDVQALSSAPEAGDRQPGQYL
ncbi:MAG: co-chaperone GroES [Actinomycetota bacterium]|nr:co-chaperone GroES [Actinomycetota bacterium]